MKVASSTESSTDWKYHQALIDTNISGEEFNEEKKYCILKESIRAKDYQLSDTERDRIREHGKRIGRYKRTSLKFKTGL